MTAEEILDRFTDDEIHELERYYLGTISGHGVRHDPHSVLRLLLTLSADERRRLGEWALRNFACSPSMRAAA